MHRYLRAALYIAVAGLAFFGARRLPYATRSPRLLPTVDVSRLSDSAQLSTMGLNSGRQLVAYVMTSAACGTCRREDVKRALRMVRDSLRKRQPHEFTQVSVVGIAIDGKVEPGLSYLKTVGLDSFDEVDIGRGWLNEQMISRVWKNGEATAAVPMVIVVTRRMTSTLSPPTMQFSGDSLLRVVLGGRELLDWVSQGTPIGYAARVVSQIDPRTGRLASSHARGTPTALVP